QGDAGEHHEDEHEGGNSVAHENLWWNLGGDPHQRERQEHVESLRADASWGLVRGAVERGEAEREETGHESEQRPVDLGAEPLEEAPNHWLRPPRARARVQPARR